MFDTQEKHWTLTFRRSTHTAAFDANRARIAQLNAEYAALAAELGQFYHAVTREKVQRMDALAEEDGGSAYSEYEQSLTGMILTAR